MEEPPLDPEEWSDEQWIAWLEHLDRTQPRDGDAPAPTRAQRLRSAAVATGVAAAMNAVHEVFYGPKKNEPEIVIEAGGRPLGPEDVELHLDPDRPENSTATVRPWLRH